MMAKTEALIQTSPVVGPVIVMPDVKPNPAAGIDITPTVGALALSPVIEMPTPEPTKPSQIVRHILSRRYPSGELFEIRATVPNGDENVIYAGLYNDHEAAINDVRWLTQKTSASAVYTNLQRIKSGEEYQQAVTNKLIQGKGTASACDIAQYVRLLIDVDTARPSEFSKSSSSDAEKAAAFEVITKIKAYIESIGLSGDLYDSGNGYHNIYALDLPATEDSKLLLKAVLIALDQKFSTDRASVDTSVYDMPRVCKLIGSYARKGEDTTDRPHRWSKILSEANELKPIPAAVLLRVAELATAPKVRVQQQAADGDIAKSLNWLRGFVDWAGLTIQNEKPHEGGIILVLESDCPFEHKSGHHAGECHAGVNREAKLAFACKHDSCAGRGWKEVRAEIERQRGERYTHGLILSAEPQTFALPSVDANAAVSVDAPAIVVAHTIPKVEQYREMLAATYPQITNAEANEIPPFDPSVINGIYGDFVELITRGTTLVPQFAYVITKTVLGMRMAGKTGFETLAAEPRYYAALIGETGSGKGESWRRMLSILQPANADDAAKIKIINSADSAAGLKDLFFQPPARTS